MNIRITNLSMTNFKCFRSKEFSFDNDITTIRGRNGEGKTTIADAILFCLFGKNVAGQSDLELFKTRENGQVIPNLDHSVEIELRCTESADPASVREANFILRRSIKEVWVKKRGSEEQVFKNNTVEYFTNGQSQTKADYEKFINSLISESVFKAITNPNYFPSLKWQEQRAFLTQMVGSIEPEYIANTDELKALVEYFDNSNEDLESYLQHLSYQIKEVKKKLEKIPVRLEEQNKALPEKLDWEAIKVEYDVVLQRLKGVESDILSIKQGNGSDIKREEIRNQIKEIESSISKLRAQAQSDYDKEYSQLRTFISEASIRFNEALNNQKLMQQTIDADHRLIKRCKEAMVACDDQLQRLRDEWPTDKFEVDPNAAFCPTCGQPLPADVVEGKIEVMRQEFNQRKEAKKKDLNERAAIIKKDKADSEEEIKKLEEKLSADEKSLEEIKENINTVFSEKAKLEKAHVKTVDEILEENDGYLRNQIRLDTFKKDLDSVTDSEDDKEKLAELEAKKAQYEAEVSNLTQQLALRSQYDRIISLIDGINEEQKSLVRQLSELEKKEDVAREYQFRQNQLLEDRINQHFKIVRWKLFKTVNNGGDPVEEPFCECYVDGIPYHSGLNQAARLNAGLDVINALCSFYNVSAPIVLDNAESTINIIETAGQQLRLQVFDSDLSLV